MSRPQGAELDLQRVRGRLQALEFARHSVPLHRRQLRTGSILQLAPDGIEEQLPLRDVGVAARAVARGREVVPVETDAGLACRQVPLDLSHVGPEHLHALDQSLGPRADWEWAVVQATTPADSIELLPAEELLGARKLG